VVQCNYGVSHQKKSIKPTTQINLKNKNLWFMKKIKPNQLKIDVILFDSQIQFLETKEPMNQANVLYYYFFCQVIS
jgi:hypothetical protein